MTLVQSAQGAAMKNLDFPVSAAAVHLHGREFHEKDFYESSPAPVRTEVAPLLPVAAAGHRVHADTQGHKRREASDPAYKRPFAQRIRPWVLAVLLLGLASSVVWLWLVRPVL